MKPVLESIQTSSIDLSRSHLQSPFALVQFLESGFNGIPAMLDLMGRPASQSARRLPRPRQYCHKSIDFESRRQTSHEALPTTLASPIELTPLVHLSNFDELENESTSSSDCDVSDTSITEPFTPVREDPITPQPVKRQDSLTFSTSTPRPSSPSVVSGFWSNLPFMLISLAFWIDIPKPSGFLAFTNPIASSDRSSVMLSLALCGMLLLWLSGCVVITLIGYVMYKIVRTIEGDLQGKTSQWGGLMLFQYRLMA